MYWLLDYEEEERIRNIIINLQKKLTIKITRNQKEQQFPFLGRKDRQISKIIIETLTKKGEKVFDPFSGSGTFSYAALDAGRVAIMNEWEPYAFQLSTAPFRGVPSKKEFDIALSKFVDTVKPVITPIYLTKCPKCKKEIMFDGLFYDRKPLNYYNPTTHERMGKNNENIIFRGRYKCECGQTEKHFDKFDEDIIKKIDSIEVDFPKQKLIENSRLNFTYPEFSTYDSLFSKRQQVALIILYNEILKMNGLCKQFFLDTFISIIHLGKYVDYRSKSQDNHCPENRLKETNLYHRFIEVLLKRYDYINNQKFNCKNLIHTNVDFRDAIDRLEDGSIDLVLTDPPYGDNAQYFEHAQRVHPFLKYNLSNDVERLSKEVVISNSPARENKHGRQQFFNDIEELFVKCSKKLKIHGFFCLYFRPSQSDWISDLNMLKHLGRKYGFEPLMTMPISNSDPSMRVLASAAWAFSKDICFIFLKLDEDECRWYEGDTDIDELVYLAACSASKNKGEPFIIDKFNEKFKDKLLSEKLMKLSGKKYTDKINKTLLRYCINEYAQFRLTGQSPYNYLNKDMNAEIRLREFVPVVIEELTEDDKGFTFEDYIIHLSSYMDNGSKKIIEKLHSANRLVPELLLQYTYENKEKGKFYIKKYHDTVDNSDKINLYSMDPHEFECLIANYFIKRGFIKAEVIGKACDRGVDILATNSEGQYELIQCKRYRKNNNIGSAPIQRIDSYMRTRKAVRAWVVTTSDFTREGIDEANITGVVIINGNDLIKSLDIYYPGMYSL